MPSGATSIGIYLEDQYHFVVKEDPKVLRNYLDKRLRAGTPFALIYQFPDGDYNHCILMSSDPIDFGRNYSKKKLHKNPHANKKNQLRRNQKQAAIELVRKCVAFVELEKPEISGHTSAEIDFGHAIAKALILKMPLPEPVPVRSVLGALTVTS